MDFVPTPVDVSIAPLTKVSLTFSIISPPAFLQFERIIKVKWIYINFINWEDLSIDWFKEKNNLNLNLNYLQLELKLDSKYDEKLVLKSSFI
jgi:hypothetical protein